MVALEALVVALVAGVEPGDGVAGVGPLGRGEVGVGGAQVAGALVAGPPLELEAVGGLLELGLLVLVGGAPGGVVGGPGVVLGAQGPRGSQVELVSTWCHSQDLTVEVFLVELLFCFHAVYSELFLPFILTVCQHLLSFKHFGLYFRGSQLYHHYAGLFTVCGSGRSSIPSFNFHYITFNYHSFVIYTEQNLLHQLRVSVCAGLFKVLDGDGERHRTLLLLSNFILQCFDSLLSTCHSFLYFLLAVAKLVYRVVELGEHAEYGVLEDLGLQQLLPAHPLEDGVHLVVVDAGGGGHGGDGEGGEVGGVLVGVGGRGGPHLPLQGLPVGLALWTVSREVDILGFSAVWGFTLCLMGHFSVAVFTGKGHFR